LCSASEEFSKLTAVNSTGEKAILRVTKGPDKGASFEVRAEIVYVGRGQENDFPLTDETLEEHELSIVYRNGRYAVCASRGDKVSVDGNLLPAEKWVWLPERARIELGQRNVLMFEYTPRETGGETGSAKDPGDSPQSQPAPRDKPPPATGLPQPGKRVPRGRKSRDAGRKPAKSPKAGVARFITDQVGDPLVKLGADGHLPELHLEEASGHQKKKEVTKSKQGNPLLVYLAIGFSVISSTLMLVIDVGPGSSPRIDQSTAREQIRQFYGTGEDQLEDYQLLLREAALAHSRSDFRREKAYYRQVLAMLLAEDNQGFIRLTKTPESDEKLRELLAILLAE
jgi:hypothetical protein